MTSLYKLADLNGDDGKPVHSKIMTVFVAVATVALLASGAIDHEAESFVLITLITAAFGHDWGKALIKSRNGNGTSNGDTTTPPAGTSSNGVA